MTTNEKIAQLRTFMAERGVQAYVVPSSDPHMGEYLPERWQTRSYLSGFTGSAGTLIVTHNASALWTDGRYFIQAQRQLQGSEIELMRMGVPGTPTFSEYLLSQLDAGAAIGLEGMVVSTAMVRELEKGCKAKSLAIADLPFPDAVWPRRPAAPATPAWELEGRYAGFPAAEKVEQLRERLGKAGADAMVVTRLDDVAWLLNARADDIAHNPYLLSFAIVTARGAQVYTAAHRVVPALRSSLEHQGFVLEEYDALLEDIAALEGPAAFLVDVSSTSYAIYRALLGNKSLSLVEGDDPIQDMKSVKSAVEIENLIRAHVKDGCAMVRFQMDLERALAAGDPVSEVEVAELVLRRRREQSEFIGPSFGSIAAYGPNAAMMHYAPQPETAAALEKRGFLLLDCGGQYLDGTTDITRTYALGQPTQEEKEYYTLVLKAHINLARAVFLEGCSGGNLDILCRDVFWKRGLDYRCGTGHGVGFVGGVHEGPHSLRVSNNYPFKAGMLVTDEPGIYEEGKLGIRIENELLCVEAMTTEYGKFLAFEPVTFCPIDTTALLVESLSSEQLDWLNAYHETVYQKLLGHLTAEEQAWLREKCKKLGA